MTRVAAAPDGRYFNPRVETMPREEIRARQLDRLRTQLSYVANNSAFYADKWKREGFDPVSVSDVDAFDAPFTTKQELRDSQIDEPPLGRHAAAPMVDVVRVHASSGTTGRPSYVGVTRDDDEDWTEVASRALYCQGLRRDDVLVHGFGLSFFVGGVPLKDAVENIGATFVPIGTGATDRLVTTARELGATALLCTPSYATYIAEYCRERLGVEPSELGFAKLMLGAEPGASIPAVRTKLERDFGAEVSDGLGNADLFPVYAATCPEFDGHHLCAEDLMLTELIEPETGERVAWEDGAEGELVASHLRRRCVPLVRFRVSDRVVVRASPCACGRTSPRVRCVGRTDDLLIVAGVNVWPSAIKDVITGMAPRTTGALQILAPGAGPRVDPPMRIQVEYGPEVADLDLLKRDVEETLRDKLIFRAAVELVPPTALPRFEMKAKLVRRIPG